MERKSPQEKSRPGKGRDEDKVKKRGRWQEVVCCDAGSTQKFYTHEIPKELKVKGPRISITFRQLVYDE